MKRGFTLVENLIAVAIFVLLASIVYQTSALLIRSVGTYRENTTISSLANQYMEIVHNLSYSSVGTLNGNPHGELPDFASSTEAIVNGINYKIYYVVNYIDNPADGTAIEGTDFASNDYKQVKLYIENATTTEKHNFVTDITPKGLENLDSRGALVIKVFDSVGQPISNANINITNSSVSPSINLSRTTDAQGSWVEVGLPDSANSYHITASKNGYSNDQTYPVTAGNPTPTKPDSTIINGQITQISFSIDKLSTLTFDTLDQSCQAISSVNLNIKGQKLIGNPSLLKFDNDYTSNSSGKISLDSIEWDEYTPSILGSTYMIYGSSPVQKVSLLPDTEQNFTLLLGPKTTNSLLVVVKDASNSSTIEGATIQVENSGLDFDESKITGGSVWNNNNWTGGSGQNNFSDPTQYYADDGGISSDLVPEALRLLSYDNGTTYVSSGSLISSTFDTGTNSTSYGTMTWQPPSQDPETEIKFQIATNNENTATTTWNFVGPDGSPSTFYTTSGTSIGSGEARYIRYKAFLSSTNPTKTPVLTSLDLNYIPGCYSPGQAFFPGLTSDTDYKITVNAPGYSEEILNNQSVSGYTTIEVLLNN